MLRVGSSYGHTNHFTEFVDASALGERLLTRIEERDAEVLTCIVAVEETMDRAD